MGAVQMKVWMDIPEELSKALRDGMKLIGLECLRHNAEIVLELFEEMVIKHVLGLQIANRTLSKLIREIRRSEKQWFGYFPRHESVGGEDSQIKSLGTRSMGR